MMIVIVLKMMIVIVLNTVTFRIISIYAHGIACTGSLCECNEYSDPSSSVGVRGSHYSTSGKTVLWEK
jgi:hypothetical protein